MRIEIITPSGITSRYLGDENDIVDALQVLYNANLHSMQASRYPSVYQLGVRYRREPVGREWWVSAPLMAMYPEAGYDCEDLASYQAAWLRASGRDPRARVGLRRSDVGWHVVVIRGDGRIEDPSRALGM